MKNKLCNTLNQMATVAGLFPATAKEIGLELPYILTKHFKFQRAKIANSEKELILATVTKKLNVTTLEKHFKRFQTTLKQPLIFVFDYLNIRACERLAQRKVQFMIPGKYLHAPVFGVMGTIPLVTKRWDDVVSNRELSAWAETILIKRLLDESMEMLSGVELAERFDVSSMTISRVLRELENADFCIVKQEGTIKRVCFGATEQLWHKAGNVLINPVLGTVNLAKLPKNLPKAGNTALEHYTMLSGATMPVYAISKREFLELKRVNKIKFPREGEEKLIVQLWRRDPMKLTKDDYIDKISLYLSEKDSTDDRTKIEIEKMMVELGLKLPNGN